GADDDQDDVLRQPSESLKNDIHALMRNQSPGEHRDAFSVETEVLPQSARVDPGPETVEVHRRRDDIELAAAQHGRGAAVALRVDDDPIRPVEGGGKEDPLVDAREEPPRNSRQV